MLRIKGLCLAGALLIAAATAASAQTTQQQTQQPAQRNTTLRDILGQVLQSPQSANVVVAGNGGWTRTAILVRRGGRLEITATGEWSAVSRGNNVTAARVGNFVTDANGYQGQTLPNSPLPNNNAGALIGRIGTNGAPFLIGASYNAEANAEGLLFLAMNDADFSDNAGRLSVAVRHTPPPQTQTPPTRDPEVPPQQTDTPTRTPGVPATTTQPAPSGEENDPPVTQEEDTPQQVDEPQPQLEDDVVTETTTQDVIEEEPATPAIPTTWVIGGLAAFFGVLGLLALMFRKPPAPRNESNIATAGVAARITDDGTRDQKLSVNWKDGG